MGFFVGLKITLNSVIFIASFFPFELRLVFFAILYSPKKPHPPHYYWPSQVRRELSNRHPGMSAVGPFTLTRDIIRRQGVRELFRGLRPTWSREIPGYFFFFGGYETARWVGDAHDSSPSLQCHAAFSGPPCAPSRAPRRTTLAFLCSWSAAPRRGSHSGQGYSRWT